MVTALETETRDAFGQRGLGLTVDVQEIDPAASLKVNNLHERMARKEPRK